MPDELSVGELGRSLIAMRQELQVMAQGINARLDKVVSTEVYALQNAYTEQRIAGLAQDVQKERDHREALEREFEQYQIAERDRRERDRQNRMYQLIVPILLALLSAGVAVWAVVAQ